MLFLQITHTLSVSLNKIGDLKYYDGDLRAARSYYFQSLNVRRDVVKNNSNVPSQVGHHYLSISVLNLAILFSDLLWYEFLAISFANLNLFRCLLCFLFSEICTGNFKIIKQKQLFLLFHIQIFENRKQSKNDVVFL